MPRSSQQLVKARARLLLQAERAFGLTVISRGAVPEIVRDEKIELSEASAPIAAAIPRAVPSSTPAKLPLAAPVKVPAPPALKSSSSPPIKKPQPPARAPIATPPTLLSDTAGFSQPVLDVEQRRIKLKFMDESEVRGCTKCRLCETRTHTVFGEGAPDASLCFIGEGPGEHEDLQARPFVGRSGELLTRQINAMGLTRQSVFILNLVKCRPPKNREPAPDEVAACSSYLERQLEIIRPKVIVTLGRSASQQMLSTKISMGNLRGVWHRWRGIDVMPTYHPAYVLRIYTPETRAAVWSDLQQVMQRLGLPLAQ